MTDVIVVKSTDISYITSQYENIITYDIPPSFKTKIKQT